MAAATIELPFISSHYAIAESTLSTLTTAPTVELVNQLLEAITTKAREHDELKSDKIRLEVELDNAVRSRDNKIKVLKSSVEKGHAEVEETRKKLHESENIRSTLESEIATLKSSSTSNESEASSLKSRISSLEASNRDTLSLLESKSAAYDKLAEELSTQHKKTIDLRRELSTAEQNLQAANSASASAKFREQSLQQDLELTKKNNEWFETELKTKSAEYLKFRKEKSARISELQRENEEISANVDSLRRSENALKSRLDEVEQRYEEALSSINQLREDAIKATESFRIELDSASRLAELQSNAAETSKQRAKECQLALDKAREDAAEQISRLRVEIETEHADKEAAERRVAELELTVSQLESDGFAGRRSMSPALNGAGPSTPMRPSTPVGAFSPRASRGKGGLTLTQMYTEYDKMRTSLAMEQKTNQELRSTLDEMVQDLEASKPEIDELRADHGRLENAVVEMSNILETAGKERDDATKEARKWQGQVEGLAREGDILRQQLRDLSAQIKVLVLENAILKEGETTYDREELEKIARQEIDDSSADLNPTGRFISRNLMTFKDLHELQEQNVTLRRMLRELGDKMEGAEAREQDAIRQQEQEELKELRIRVQTYRDEIANLVAQTKSYVKERDTFRSMLTRRRQTVGDASVFSQSLPLGAAPPASEEPAKDVPDYADLLRKVQAHFDSFREESATDHAALKQQVNELSRKNSELMSEISRSSSQLVAATQRAELLQGNFDMLKNENAEMQKRYATLLENANRQDIRTQQAAEDLVETKGLVESLQRENANLKAEKDLWKNIEKRLIEDNETLRNERGRLDSLNANLQTILNEREHTDAESRRRLQSSVESLESELQSTKRKLNDEVEEGKKASLRREYEHEQSQKRIDDLVTSLGAAREELVAAKTTRDHLQSRVDELTVELRSAEERLQVVQTKPSVSAAPTEAPAVPEEGQESGLTREQELGIEVSELRRDLELTKNELQHAEERVEDYKAISQQSEERLQSVTETQEQYREETERLIEEKDKKIQDLEKRIEEISTELSTTNGELTKLRDEQGEAGRHLEEQKAALEAEITRLKDENERQIASAQFHQEDLKAQAEIAQHAQQNYETELVKHAEAAKTLQLVRSEANQLKLEVVELRTQADTFKKDLAQKEESWTEIKDRYESELTELQKRREEVLHQNSLLHTQLENITNQIAALQRDRANIPEGDEDGEAGAPNLEGLQEVIKFLRREKEIVDVQYHLSTQESKRLRQQLDYTQTQLDEARLKLEQQRRAAADSEHSALSHNKLMETLNELNLFRESSVTLRNQVKQAETSLAEKSSRIEELVQQIQPLETRIRELENTVETKDGELKLLQDDRDRWQQRTQNILQKYDRVDPAEMEGLKEKLETLEKERDEAVAARDTLQTQAAAFPEQLKHAEDRVQELRTKLTDQFKARSKELTGRINAKQVELNTVVQEKEVIQEELKTTREELNELKTRMAEKPAAPAAPAVEGATGVDSTPASQFPAPTTQPPAASDDQRVKALEEKVRRLEAALAEKETALAAKETEHEAKIKERSDKLKEMFNSKLAEVRAAHRQEVERLKSSQPAAPQEPGTPAPKSEQVPATPATPAAAPATPSKDTGLPELTDAQARELVAKNETIRNIIRSNIRTQVAKQKETDKQESQANQEAMSTLEQKFNEEREALKKAHEEGVEEKIKAAVELSDKKSLAKLSMLDTRYRTAQAKIDVVQKAATETPQKPVVEVWEVAKTTRAPPAAQAKPAQVASPAPAPSPAPAAAQATPVVPSPSPAPTATPAATPATTPAAAPQAQPAEPAAASTAEPPSAESTPQTGAPAQQQPQQQPAPEQAAQQQAAPATAQPTTNAPPNPFGQSQNKQPTSLPSKPPAGNAPGLMRALTSGLPVARGGRTGGRGGSQANPFGQQQGQQQQAQGQGQAQQQAPSQRGSGLPRGRGGRGGHGRGGNQNVQATNAAQQGQASPGRSLNAGARQFVPQGNKRAREDGGEAGGEGGATGGKRMRGGGHTRGS